MPARSSPGPSRACPRRSSNGSARRMRPCSCATAPYRISSAGASISPATARPRGSAPTPCRTSIAYDRATRGVMKIYRSREALDNAQRSTDYLAQHGLLYERVTPDRCVELEPALRETKPTLAGALYFARDEVRSEE